MTAEAQPTPKSPSASLRTPGASARYGPGGPDFKAWFRQSMVVDGQGQPIVVYHGTYVRHPFAPGQFGRQRQRDGTTCTGLRAFMWFAQNPNYANLFAGDSDDGLWRPRVYPVYLSVQRPLDLMALGTKRVPPRGFAASLLGAGLAVDAQLERALRDLPNGLDLAATEGCGYGPTSGMRQMP